MTKHDTMSRTGVSGLLDVDTIKGRRILNRSDEKLGTVDLLYIDAEEHVVRYVSVDIGHFLGIGTKPILVPFERMQWNGPDLHLDADDAMIRRAPEFQPGLAHDHAYESQVLYAWDVAPYWATPSFGLNHRHLREDA